MKSSDPLGGAAGGVPLLGAEASADGESDGQLLIVVWPEVWCFVFGQSVASYSTAEFTFVPHAASQQQQHTNLAPATALPSP